MRVRPLQHTDGPLLRELQLRMYADAPDAFSETLAQAQALSAADWETRAERYAEAKIRVALVAVEGDEALGFISGYVGRFHDGAIHWDVEDTVSLARAWVDPCVRRRGAGRALAAAVEAWARERGARALETQVTENNEPAIRFYVALGFADTGRREPLLSNPALQIHFLRRPL
ncbi:MAG: GNAT family N-acetyltransferase [Planctomycetota bacterium]